MLVPAVTFMLASLLHPVAQPTPGEIAQRLDALQETGRVLYVAAHPDDENTQFLAWAATGQGYDAAYLSLTRGDGGQNLIGDEQSPLMGVIRTWELLSARSTDGARQFIGSARDFGYSKSAEEALSVWGHEETLADVVWTVRQFRPHVIVTRFPEEGSTHGHHLASARLAREAFEAAGDPSQFPEQLEFVDTWSPTRIVYNVSTWHGPPAPEDAAQWVEHDIGGYQSLWGRSFGEIAAASRGMHRSQGFGWWSSRGPRLEWFSPVDGEESQSTLFADIDTRWATTPGGDALDALFEEIAASFDARAPEASIPALLDALDAINELEDTALAETTRAELTELIVACAGLVVDARADSAFAPLGSTLPITWSALSRADAGLVLDSVTIATTSADASVDAAPAVPLANHEPQEGALELNVPSDAAVSAPYWLSHPYEGGRYHIPSPTLRGAPIAPPAMTATFTLTANGRTLSVERPVRHIEREPVLGERARAVLIVPAATVTPEENVRMLAGDSTDVRVQVRAYQDLDGARVHLGLPEGWSATPTHVEVSAAAGGSAEASFSVTAPSGASRATVVPVITVDGAAASWREDTIDYPHLPPQRVLRPAEMAVQPVELTPYSGTVGYVMGPGDAVARNLAAVGVDVRLLGPDELTADTLQEFDVVLIGIRAFNVHAALADRLPTLLDWVEGGGTLITQYQTNSRVSPLEVALGAADITIARGRVTDETAAITVLEPDHPVFNAPHAISDADWSDWVQERGLYFAESWDDVWTPLLEMNDAGEEPLAGALLVDDHGAGHVVYTGISFFRQLPAGVPGAYRLLINLLNLGGAP